MDLCQKTGKCMKQNKETEKYFKNKHNSQGYK